MDGTAGLFPSGPEGGASVLLLFYRANVSVSRSSFSWRKRQKDT